MSAALAYTDASTTARALHVLDRTQLAAWRTTQSATVNAWIDAQGFAAGAGSLLLLPGEDGLAGAVVGIGLSYAVVAYLNINPLVFSFGREQITLHPTLQLMEVGGVLGLAVLVSALASLQPAWRAARMDPIQALRHV